MEATIETQQTGSKSQNPSNPWDKDWSTSTHAELYVARSKAKTQEEQDKLAGLEHQAFAREATAENPLLAVPIALATPLYQAGKALGLTDSRSKPSVTQLGQGLKGIGEGLAEAVKKPWDKFWGKEASSETPKTAPNGPWVKNIPVDKFEQVFNKLIKQESGGKHEDARGYLIASGKGAKGITQVMADTGISPGYGVEPIKNKSKEEYLRFGKDYLKAMLNKFGGDYEKALAAYNAGPGNVDKAIKKGGTNWKDHLPKKSETLPYIKNIMSPFESENKKSGSGYIDPDSDEARKINEKLPTISGKEFLDSKLTTKAERASWYKTIKKEWEAGKKGMTRKEEDSYYSNPEWLARKKYPKEYTIWSKLNQQEIDGFSDGMIDVLSKNHKYSFTEEGGGHNASGWVYSKNPDRAFLTGSADKKTMAHESEHLEQHEDRKAHGSAASVSQASMVGAYNAPISKLARWTAKNRDDPAVREVFNADNAHDSTPEWLANLSAHWKTSIPSGTSWSDTPFYKKLEKEFGKEEAQKMMHDALLTLTKAPYTRNR